MRSPFAHGRTAGFTLLELVLVLVIICTILAMAAPSLRGWNKASRLRDAASDFLSTARFARSQAAATGQLHRLCVDSASRSYWLMAQEGQEFANIASSLGRALTLPEGFAIDLTSSDATASPTFIEFYATGRTQPGRVRIISDHGDQIEIVCASPAESYHIVSSGEPSP
jgi:type II secretion system protein H